MKRAKRNKRPVKVYYLSTDGAEAGNLLTNIHVLTQFLNLYALLLGILYIRRKDAYLRTLDYPVYGRHIKAIAPDLTHPLIPWIQLSGKNLNWFNRYCMVVFSRYHYLVPGNKLAETDCILEIANKIVVGVDPTTSRQTAFPHHLTWGSGSHNNTQQAIENEYFSRYHKYGVFSLNGLTYPKKFVEYMRRNKLSYTELGKLPKLHN